MNQFWEILSSVADVLGIVSAVPMLAAAVLFAHRAHRYRLRLQAMEGQTTAHSIALAVSLTGLDISEQVRAFLMRQGKYWQVRVYQRSNHWPDEEGIETK